jgi:hypothetical protein
MKIHILAAGAVSLSILCGCNQATSPTSAALGVSGQQAVDSEQSAVTSQPSVQAPALRSPDTKRRFDGATARAENAQWRWGNAGL